MTMTRSFDKEEWYVDQQLSQVDESITQYTMMIETSFAEVGIDLLEQIWTLEDKTANAVPTPNETYISVGAPEYVNEWPIAFIVDKRQVSGTGYIRAYAFHRAKWDGSDSTHAFNKGEKTLVPITFKLFGEESPTVGGTFGIILDQDMP